jgi:hypothetical protein
MHNYKTFYEQALWGGGGEGAGGLEPGRIRAGGGREAGGDRAGCGSREFCNLKRQRQRQRGKYNCLYCCI